MTDDLAREEIRAAIAFYESRGWDWLDVVAFIAARARPPIARPRAPAVTRYGNRVGRPRRT